LQRELEFKFIEYNKLEFLPDGCASSEIEPCCRHAMEAIVERQSKLGVLFCA
jgi:hypothetical protein